LSSCALYWCTFISGRIFWCGSDSSRSPFCLLLYYIFPCWTSGSKPMWHHDSASDPKWCCYLRIQLRKKEIKIITESTPPPSHLFLALYVHKTSVAEQELQGTTLFLCTVARSQNGKSANFAKTFGQMRKNSAFLEKYVFTALNHKNSIQMFCLEILSWKSSDDNCLQKPINPRKNHIFHAVWPPNFGWFCVILLNFWPAGNSVFVTPRYWMN
jgi:hypothetical protein